MSYNNPRIQVNHSLQDIIIKMADGNPGAIRVLMELISNAERIDPQDMFGPLGPLLSLDTLDVYADRIWMFYKDVCRCNLVDMIGLQRAEQLGLLTATRLIRAIDGVESFQSNEISAYLTQVRATLKDFTLSHA